MKIRNSMRGSLLGLLATSALVLSVETGFAQSASDVVATVNGNEITMGDVVLVYENLPADVQSQGIDALWPQIIDQLVNQEILAGEADLNDPKTVQAVELQTQSTLASIVFDEKLNEAVTDARVQEVYDELIGNAEPIEEYSAAHILVESEEDANAIVEELNNGGDFAKLAEEKSKDPGSAAQGGDLGWFTKGRMVPAFEEKVIEMSSGEAGAVSAPVKSDFGWHIIKFQGKREQPKPTLEEVRPNVEDYIRQEASQGLLTSLKEGADVVINEEVGPGQFEPNIAFE